MMCVSLRACVQCFRDVLVKLAVALLTFVNTETGCFHQPTTQPVGFSWDLLPILKVCEPEATHYNLLSYQNQKYNVQQCNNATLCLWSWCTATFSVRGEEGILLVSVSLCVVSSCLKLIWFPLFLCVWGGGVVVGRHGRRVGGARTVIISVIWLWA